MKHTVSSSHQPVESKSVGDAAKPGLFSGTMLVVGNVIGSGIFLSPSLVAARTGTSALILTAWALGAVVSRAGAFVYAMDDMVFADWIFFGATGATLFVWQWRDRTQGDGVQVSSSNPGSALRRAPILAAGIPVNAYWNRGRQETSHPRQQLPNTW